DAGVYLVRAPAGGPTPAPMTHTTRRDVTSPFERCHLMRSSNLRRSLLATVAALSLGLPVVGAALPASADALECGDTIMVSTVLTQDLSCTSGDGLVIGADNVVLDLDGHTI